LFQRQGNDVIIEVPISFVQAALGATVEVPTIDGKVDLKIAPGTQPGTVLRIRNHGIPFLRGSGRGNELVKVKVLTPQKLSSKQKELLQQFDDSCSGRENPEQKSWLDKMKEFIKGYGD
jgi:molecular chaperone DnaJ